MNTQHPEALRAATETAELRQARQQIKEQIAEAMTSHKVRFMSVGNYTFCYRVLKHDVIELSSTIRAPGDRPDKIMGRAHALNRFAAGQRILLKRPRMFNSIKDFLTVTFTSY